ncbi:MAG TPA: PEP-utilizing enzyme [Patescibacteria group bacterium]|nr:PEP-utilizing enzyme [Patescibacteria group bacterium]
MADHKLAELLKTQKSLTEWLEDIKHRDVETIRTEDNVKRERLGVVNGIIGLPFDKPTQFEAADLRDDNPEFARFLKERGDELCALRLNAKEKGLPKFRMRGLPITKAYAWFKEQDIDPRKYLADFVPHPPDYSWATIFIVNKHGMQGEIIFGGHHQLTQGFHDTVAPIVFRYDFKTWSLHPHNSDALEHLKTLAAHIHVTDKTKQKALKDAVDATFTHDYIEGYFETADSSMGTWFIDYSPALGKMFTDTVVRTAPAKAAGGQTLVSGQTGSPGSAAGIVCIVSPDNLDIDFPKGGILVCEVTTPNYVPLMQKAAAIVTDQGGILSHAAIVARELHKPCVVGTTNATKKLKDGQAVVVHADDGTVTKVAKK